MHIVVYIVAGLYIVLTCGLIFAYYRERHPGTLLMAAAYGIAAGLALLTMHWWPLLAGFALVWAFRFMGFDPEVPRQPPG